jgi:hypothetical protein
VFIWRKTDIDLRKQIDYKQFENTIRVLNASGIAKVYLASVLSEDGRPIYCIEIEREVNHCF